MARRPILQGDIYWCELDGIDHEQQGVHPVLVISNDKLNKSSGNVTILPITHRTKKYMPYHYILTKDKYDFFSYSKNTVQPDCIRHISKRRLQRYIGTIDVLDVLEIICKINYLFTIKS